MCPHTRRGPFGKRPRYSPIRRADENNHAAAQNRSVNRLRGGLTKGRESMAKSGGKKKKAETVFLVCKETGDYNYTLRRKPGGEKLNLKKYCPRLRKHTQHVEKKK